MAWNVPLHLRCKPTYTGPGWHGFSGVRRFLDLLGLVILLVITGVGGELAVQLLKLK